MSAPISAPIAPSEAAANAVLRIHSEVVPPMCSAQRCAAVRTLSHMELWNCCRGGGRQGGMEAHGSEGQLGRLVGACCQAHQKMLYRKNLSVNVSVGP